MLKGTSPDSHAWETAWENDVHPGGQMLFLSLSRQPVLLLLLFITLKEDPWRVFTVPRFPSVLHASMLPSPNEQELLLSKGKWKLVRAYNIWCVSNKPYIYSSPDTLILYTPLMRTHMGTQFNLYNNKKEHSIYFMPYDMYTIVVLLGTQAGTYCCQSLSPD